MASKLSGNTMPTQFEDDAHETEEEKYNKGPEFPANLGSLGEKEIGNADQLRRT